MIVGAVAVLRIMIRMMMLCTYLVPPKYLPQILPHHPVTTLNPNLNPRSIAVWWWMWMPCQAMAVLCRCSAKESTSFTVQDEMNRQATEHSHFKRK